MKKSAHQQSMRYGTMAALFLAAALFVLSFTAVGTGAKYVTEIGGGSFDYETQSPCIVDSQQDLFNAIQSGYGYIQLAENLKAPIIMTGDALDLRRDLTIDLNGNEIERNNRASLLNVPSGTTFTVIDTKGGGGLYNPIGSVLTVTGGNMNVYGGTFESGPRPSEYYSTLQAENYTDPSVGTVTQVQTDGTAAIATHIMPRLPVRTSGAAMGSGNIYFDKDFTYDGKTLIKRDTYCYVVVEGLSNDSLDSYNVTEADFAYTYFVDGTTGLPVEEGAFGAQEALLFGYENDVAFSVDRYTRQNGDIPAALCAPADTDKYGYGIDASGNRITENTPGYHHISAPNYAAVRMTDGKLNINVIQSKSEAEREMAARSRTAGSFYSYFGTWQTYCIYIMGGNMTVSTSGELKTVDPDELPAIVTDAPGNEKNDSSVNSAKFSESACILSDGGTLDFRLVASATSYNGSVVSVSEGNVTMRNVERLVKNATMSHADDPFSLTEVEDVSAAEEDDGGKKATVFPRGQQYRDAAVFVNGGSLDISYSTVTVNKDIHGENGGVAKNRTDGEFNTTFGILSRGRGDALSKLLGQHVDITMQGDHSYGVFGTRGEIKLSHGTIRLDSDYRSYGIYAVNKTSRADNVVKIELDTTIIDLGNATASGTYVGTLPDRTDWESGTYDSGDAALSAAHKTYKMRAASVGVYLDSSEYRGGTVTMKSSTIQSQEMGVAVNGGDLTFYGGGTIEAYNASAVYLNGGNITFAESALPYSVRCEINRKGNGADKNADGTEIDCRVDAATALLAGTHAYEVYLPWQENRDGSAPSAPYKNHHGICVEGGKLEAEGTLNVWFRGLYNDISQYKRTDLSEGETNYDKLVIKSFAVACMVDSDISAENTDGDNIRMASANIVSTVGGGVKVQGGQITMGNESKDLQKSITVETCGRAHLWNDGASYNGNNSYYPVAYGYTNYASIEWMFFPNLSGGHAVISRGGNINIYNGTYTAAYSNGVAASTDDVNTQSAKLNIYGGTFGGNMSHGSDAINIYIDYTSQWGDRTATASGASVTKGGPASHYGLKVMGYADVNVYGGTFTGKNGGAFVRGRETAEHVVQYAALNAYAGTFGTPSQALQNDGADGVNVFDYSRVTFGAYSDEALTANGYATSEARYGVLQVYANLFPIAVNPLLDGTTTDRKKNDVLVNVYYGTYYIRNTDRSNLGLGAIDDRMDYVDFHIYGVGVNVFDQPRPADQNGNCWVNAVRIRGADDAPHVYKTLSVSPQYNRGA